MIRGTDVNFVYEYEDPAPNDHGDHEVSLLDVTAHVSDYYPAVMYLRNGDPGYPAEGGEVEDLEVIDQEGFTWTFIPEDLYKTLEELAIDEAGQC